VAKNSLFNLNRLGP